jgi:multicomponent Na+:H+ antiporter subunit B
LQKSQILICIIRFLYPFTLLFGVYIIINGDLSPGGGFQGGAVLATAYLITNFINSEQAMDIEKLIKIEKYLFCSIICVASLSLITRGELFTNFIPGEAFADIRRVYLVALNTLIGLKVATGLIIIFDIFIEEER